MTSLSDNAEQFLAVEFENAAIDGCELADPCQYLLELPQYRDDFISALLSKARRMQAELALLKQDALRGNVHIYPAPPPSCQQQETTTYAAFGWQGPDHEGGNSSWIDEPF